MKDNNQFFLILGMHRSGTSCLAGALERCGLYLGDVRRNGHYNKRGYFEIKAVQEIHDNILHLNDGCWHTPPLRIDTYGNYREELAVYAANLMEQKTCGLKDPRILLMLDMWRQIIGSNCKMVGTFRHPMAVAKSLAERNGLTIEHGLQLWEYYNRLLIEAHQKSPFPLIEYNLSTPKIYSKNLLTLVEQLNLKPQKLRLKLFISGKLEHHKFTEYPQPAACSTIYEYLQANKIQ